MTRSDPLEAARSAKHVAALHREARAIRRRVDKLVAISAGAEPPLPTLIGEVMEALERVVYHLMRREHAPKAQARDVLRRR